MVPSKTSITELAAEAHKATPLIKVFLTARNILVVVETGSVLAIFLYYLYHNIFD